MERTPQGDKTFSSSLEAILFLEEKTREIVAWLHKCMNSGARLPAFPHYRSRLNDVSNMTRRWIIARERKIMYLQEKLDEVTTSSLCPRCGQTQRTLGEEAKE